MTAGDAALELVGGSPRHDVALVEHRDPLRELVGFIEILSRQKDRDPRRSKLADDLPHRQAAARVQAGRGLIEENDARLTDQCHREIEASPHPARVGRKQLVRGGGEVELLQQLRDPQLPGLAAEMAKAAIICKFSAPVSRLSTAEN